MNGCEQLLQISSYFPNLDYECAASRDENSLSFRGKIWIEKGVRRQGVPIFPVFFAVLRGKRAEKILQ